MQLEAGPMLLIAPVEGIEVSEGDTGGEKPQTRDAPGLARRFLTKFNTVLSRDLYRRG
jgi:hypothetical protein